MNIPKIPTPTNPYLSEVIIAEMQTILADKLTWLDYSFGKCQRLRANLVEKESYFPAIHIEKGEYLNVFPCSELGNFSFFYLPDPVSVAFKPHQYNQLKVKFALIFWFNLETIITASDDRNLEAVKSQILDLLTRKMFLTNGYLLIDNIFEQAENIYKGFDIKEIDTQFLTQPYAGLRFEGTLIFNEICENGD